VFFFSAYHSLFLSVVFWVQINNNNINNNNNNNSNNFVQVQVLVETWQQPLL